MVLATKRPVPTEFASSLCDLTAICSGFVFPRPQLKSVAFFSVSLCGGCFYLLVQHCHGWELSCSTKSPSFSLEMPLLWEDFWTKRGATLGDFCRFFQKLWSKGPLPNYLGPSICSTVWTKNSLFPHGLSNLSNQAGIANFASPGIFKKPAALNFLLLLSWGSSSGLPQTSVGLSCIMVLSSIYSTAL